MRIAYGTTVLQRALREKSLDGIGRYSGELWADLDRINILRVSPFVFSGKRLGLKSDCTMSDAGSFIRQAAFSLASGREFPVTAKLVAGHAELVHSTDHFIPRINGIPVVATLHDAIPLSRPEWINYSFKSLKNAMWRKSAHWARHILTVSEFSKREVAEWFGIPLSKITVTPLGISNRWFADADADHLARVRKRHDLPPRFFLFVGTLQPRKNVLGLIEAHRTLPADLRRSVPLIVGGRAGWSCEAEVKILEGLDDGCLRWLRHVPDEDLSALLQAASAFVLPSLHEGFGLPVLEAFASATPVVASNAGSIPEVAGDAALLFDPVDTKAMANAMRRVVDDRDLAETLRGRGRERARLFTWERTAKLTVEVYQRVLADWKN